MTFPIDAINTLLSMVRGTTSFNLLASIKAVLAIAEYSVSLFDANALPMSAKSELSLEKALQMVKEQHAAHVATASSINTALLSYILKLGFHYLASSATGSITTDPREYVISQTHPLRQTALSAIHSKSCC